LVDPKWISCYNNGIVSKKELAMKNWTDSCINWHQLSGTEVKRLLDTWGMTERQIANYDVKHGYATAPKAEPATKKVVEKAPAKKTAEAKPAAKAPAKTPAKKTATKVVQKAATRQKHTGADGEIKFLDHRDLYVGFWGGRVVVTKRTEAQCRAYLTANHGTE
jgi:hypothetical protein